VVRVPPGKKRIALTFDAGASGEPWPRILGALREHHVHITMFFTGKFAEQYPDCVKQAVADGHEIANHTYSHLDSRTLTDDQLIGELARTEEIIRNLTGVTTKPYWRPPFGARNNHVLNVAVSQGYRSIYWTLDSLDSVGQPKTPDFIFNRVTNTPGVNLDGAIILQHFGSDASADALPRELDRLQEMGLRVVTISELLSP
jgi:peptidoglycan/xylan/chitin deacetylase (PgdA/CDA1 family)